MKISICCLIVSALPLQAAVEVSKVFTSHMVLQRGMAVPVYGTAAADEKVEVKFRAQTKTATADKEGRWLVKLDPLEAGGPDVLMIGDKKIEDVLVGDVWIGSGQSNMDMPVSAYVGNDAVLAAAAK
jgi:sialate O-acetylesterase